MTPLHSPECILHRPPPPCSILHCTSPYAVLPVPRKLVEAARIDALFRSSAPQPHCPAIIEGRHLRCRLSHLCALLENNYFIPALVHHLQEQADPAIHYRHLGARTNMNFIWAKIYMRLPSPLYLSLLFTCSCPIIVGGVTWRRKINRKRRSADALFSRRNFYGKMIRARYQPNLPLNGRPTGDKPARSISPCSRLTATGRRCC